MNDIELNHIAHSTAHRVHWMQIALEPVIASELRRIGQYTPDNYRKCYREASYFLKRLQSSD